MSSPPAHALPKLSEADALRAAKIQACRLPDDALLQKYREQGNYTDCFATEVAGLVSRAEYVEAFYTTPVFKAERQVLRWLVSTPSTDAEARRLACEAAGSFAAWTVEDQAPAQLLLRDLSGRTRSWLMVQPLENVDGSRSTRLYFGSAVLPVVDARSGRASQGIAFNALFGFHKVYSRVLLAAARSRLSRQLK